MKEIELTEAKKRDLKINPHGPFTPRNIKGWHCIHTERAVYGFWEAALIRDESVAAMILDKPVTRVWVTDRGELELDIYPHMKKDAWRNARQTPKTNNADWKSSHLHCNTKEENKQCWKKH